MNDIEPIVRVSHSAPPSGEALDLADLFGPDVIHDLRAPLRHIQGFCRILAQEEEALTALPDYLERILTSARSLEEMIRHLEQISELARCSMRPTAIDQTKLARFVWDEIRHHEKERFEFRLEALPEVDADAGLMRLVWRELFLNSLKFAARQEHPRVGVSARNADRNWFIVEDNGVGFDPRYADRMFGLFQRLHSKRDFEGVGAGLALVTAALARHGGEISAHGETGRGARFEWTPERVKE
ncbi:MAG TPA: ATP-binding protein [Acidobacteriota bacterium]|nr:ATP-binding protein [Acidobacteriota bacterium]